MHSSTTAPPRNCSALHQGLQFLNPRQPAGLSQSGIRTVLLFSDLTLNTRKRKIKTIWSTYSGPYADGWHAIREDISWRPLRKTEDSLQTTVNTTQWVNYLEEHPLHQSSLQTNCIRLDSSYPRKRKPNTKKPNQTQHLPTPQIPHILFKASLEGGNFLCRSLLVTAETDTWLFACCPHPTSALVLFPFSSRARCQLGDMESLGSYTSSAEHREERVTDFAFNRSVSFHNKPVKSFHSQLFAFIQRIFLKQESLHHFN